MDLALVMKCVTNYSQRSKAVLAFNIAAKASYALYIIIKQSMIFAVDIMHGRAPGSIMHSRLQPKKIKVRLYCIMGKVLFFSVHMISKNIFQKSSASHLI